jgi:ferric-dicitrate binding protein FerR (iron transport regulator)
MPNISDHHQYLFLGKITNSLTPEEHRELQELFARDDRAQEAYEQLLRQLPAEQVEGAFSHLDTPGFWKNLSGEIRDQQTHIRRRKVLRATVVIALIGSVALSGWWFLAGKTTDRHQAPIAQTPARSVELRMADGSKVDLTATTGKLQKGQLVLDNNNSSLSYQDLGGSSATRLNTVDVPIAMDYKITLSDSSEIWLNSVSSLSFPSTFAADKREITIRGEAYCRIAKRANQPFIIHLPGNTVQVTGTELNVNTYDPSAVRIALVDGGVNLLSETATVKINPGFQAVSADGKIEQAPFQADKVLSWRQGRYSFDGAELEEISMVLARWFGTTTRLDDPSLAHKKFAGALYKKRPLSSFLDNFKVISHIDSWFDEKGTLHFTAAK